MSIRAFYRLRDKLESEAKALRARAHFQAHSKDRDETKAEFLECLAMLCNEVAQEESDDD